MVLLQVYQSLRSKDKTRKHISLFGGSWSSSSSLSLSSVLLSSDFRRGCRISQFQKILDSVPGFGLSSSVTDGQTDIRAVRKTGRNEEKGLTDDDKEQDGEDDRTKEPSPVY